MIHENRKWTNITEWLFPQEAFEYYENFDVWAKFSFGSFDKSRATSLELQVFKTWENNVKQILFTRTYIGQIVLNTCISAHIYNTLYYDICQSFVGKAHVQCMSWFLSHPIWNGGLKKYYKPLLRYKWYTLYGHLLPMPKKYMYKYSGQARPSPVSGHMTSVFQLPSMVRAWAFTNYNIQISPIHIIKLCSVRWLLCIKFVLDSLDVGWDSLE